MLFPLPQKEIMIGDPGASRSVQSPPQEVAVLPTIMAQPVLRKPVRKRQIKFPGAHCEY
jgi:hypothetical protein